MSGSLRFKSREARDQSARNLRRDGARNIRKSSSRSTVVSPDYVADATPDEGVTNGYGGRAPQFYAVLYTVEWSNA